VIEDTDAPWYGVLTGQYKESVSERESVSKRIIINKD
jgi:hypothetical protein